MIYSMSLCARGNEPLLCPDPWPGTELEASGLSSIATTANIVCASQMLKGSHNFVGK